MATCQLSLKIGLLNPAEWIDACPDLPLPLQQHPTYGRALESYGATAEQVTISDNHHVIGRALLIQRKFFGAIRFTTLFRGPIWCRENLPDKTKIEALKLLQNHFSPLRWNFLCTMPEMPDTLHNRTLLKHIKARRVMSGFSTVWVDLRPSKEDLRAALKGKWRNQLTKAEKSNLAISVGGRKEHQYNWLLEKEAAQRSKRRYQATPLGLVPTFIKASTPKSASGLLSLTALSGREKVAGALFLLHGNSATYHIGWANDTARTLNAQNRILWEGMLALKQKGIHFLDLGGLNTTDLAGIARFKLGMGAEPLTLVGAYI